MLIPHFAGQLHETPRPTKRHRAESGDPGSPLSYLPAAFPQPLAKSHKVAYRLVEVVDQRSGLIGLDADLSDAERLRDVAMGRGRAGSVPQLLGELAARLAASTVPPQRLRPPGLPLAPRSQRDGLTSAT